jgi:hypothetical protein
MTGENKMTEKMFQVREKKNGEYVAMASEKAAKIGAWSTFVKPFDTMKEAEDYAYEWNNAPRESDD